MGKSISTTKKGDEFEMKMFEMIQSLLLKDELPINGKNSKVYRKKAYYSSKRKADIIVDISVECILPGEQEVSSFLMIECKDYSHAVPVDDVEEFYTKTQQITGLNVKAIMLTTNVLQIGALNFAQANGIRVMRIKSDGGREILSFRKEKSTVDSNSRDYINAVIMLTSPEYINIGSLIGVGPGKVYHNFFQMIADAIGSN